MSPFKDGDRATYRELAFERFNGAWRRVGPECPVRLVDADVLRDLEFGDVSVARYEGRHRA